MNVNQHRSGILNQIRNTGKTEGIDCFRLASVDVG
jgi:hypothetical protein